MRENAALPSIREEVLELMAGLLEISSPDQFMPVGSDRDGIGSIRVPYLQQPPGRHLLLEHNY